MDSVGCIRSKLRSCKGDCKVTNSEEVNADLCDDCQARGQVKRKLTAAAEAYQRHYPATFPLAFRGSATATRATPNTQEVPQRAFPDKSGLRLPQTPKTKEKEKKKKKGKRKSRNERIGDNGAGNGVV
ncbi:hypothetical protein MMC30_005451 [Trapelia coarctata]|nr:hypothetical protein [Trapelia coarctata]